ncbi:MAG TPA: class I SAM-dependent methyltransferase [Gemmatimonadaceae bacterium]
MSDPVRLGADAVREAWDRAADGYDAAQASGLDYYRYEFFGPAQAAICGDVRGLRLLDVGCGSGYFAREMARRGAAVTAVDISARMIAHAERHAAADGLAIEHRVADAAALATLLPAASFDVATSCLALQDMPDPAAALRAVHAVLRPGGRFVASISHPCTETPFRRWERDGEGRKRWLCIDRYFDRVPMEFAWVRWSDPPFTTVALHATLEDWLTWSLDAGFALRALREPRPTEAALRARPELAAAARVPYYVVFDLGKSG